MGMGFKTHCANAIDEARDDDELIIVEEVAEFSDDEVVEDVSKQSDAKFSLWIISKNCKWITPPAC